jgi:hypothetical protein
MQQAALVFDLDGTPVDSLRVPPQMLAPDAWLHQFVEIPPALARINRMS